MCVWGGGHFPYHSVFFLQDQILKRGMIILRQEVIEEEGIYIHLTLSLCMHVISCVCVCVCVCVTGVSLLKKLAVIWTQFYTSILPTLQAIFAPVQVLYSLYGHTNDCSMVALCLMQLENLSIRALSLLTFRDVLLLKTQINCTLFMKY